VLIHLREADFWRYFFWEEHIRRFMADDAQHIEPFWFYLPVVLLGVLPWSFQLPAAIRGYRHAPLRDSWQRFVLLWTLMPLLFFSISKGKLVTYIIPCFAPLAVWLADGLDRYMTAAKPRKAFDRGALAACGLCLLLALVLLGTWFLPARWQVFQPTEWAIWLGAVGLFVLAAGCAYQAWRLEAGERKLMAFALSGFVIMAGSTYVIPHKALATKTPQHFLAGMQSEIGPDDILISDDNMFHAVCWYYQRADVYLLMRMGELKYGMHRPDGRRQFLSRDDFKKLLAAEGGQGRLVLIYKYRGQYDDLPAEPLFEAREGMFVFRKY
jgi:4-amino-4-deoxy-L-arabinose transferase